MMTVLQELHESVFGTIEQTCLQVILSKLVERLRALACRQIRAVQQVRVNADCTIELAAPPKEIAQRLMQLDRFRIELDDFDECIDRFVGLIVQQVIEAAKVRARQRGVIRFTGT